MPTRIPMLPPRAAMMKRERSGIRHCLFIARPLSIPMEKSPKIFMRTMYVIRSIFICSSHNDYVISDIVNDRIKKVK